MSAFVFKALTALVLASVSVEEEARTLMEQGRVAEAFALVEQAAGENNAAALDYLAWFYDTGKHVRASKATAARLYRRAAAMGVPHAQWRLGVMIDQGEAEPASLEEAFELISSAASKGYSNALVSLGVMKSAGRGTPRDYPGALASYKAAARLGNPDGFNETGVVYLNGEGVPQDDMEAAAWFMIAASMRDSEGTRHFSLMIEKLGESRLPEITERANSIGREYGMLERSPSSPSPSI